MFVDLMKMSSFLFHDQIQLCRSDIGENFLELQHIEDRVPFHFFCQY